MSIDFPPVRVSSLFAGRLSADIVGFVPTDIVSLIDPDLHDARRPVFPPGIRVLQQPFFDVERPADLAADSATIAQVTTFLAAWTKRIAAGETTRLLVHCHMGISRSTAVAYTSLAMVAGPGHEHAAFDQLLNVTIKPWPNRLVVALADADLGRGGALLDPLDSYRAAHPRRYRAYGRLNRQRGLY